MVDKRELCHAIRVNDGDLLGRLLLDIANIAVSGEGRPADASRDMDDLKMEVVGYLWRKMPGVKLGGGRNPFAYMLRMARRYTAKLQRRARSKRGHRREWERREYQRQHTMQTRRPASFRHEAGAT